MFAAAAFGGGHGGGDGSFCRMCFHSDADVRILGCGCEMHARCVPVSLVVSEGALHNHEIKPNPPNSLLCPACRASPVSRIYLKPLSSEYLDKAVSLKREALQKKGTTLGFSAEEPDFPGVQAETSYLLMSHNQGSSGVPSDHDYQRTGRWTDQETAFVDFLVEAFDSGKIPVEKGLKLNEFLSDVLLCKSSRLTKKMKNARLSVRAYNFASPVLRLDVEVMSSLEQKFLDSMTSESSRLELKFNLTRLWRSHLSNLCLQVGSSLLDANDWIGSLEESERRASEAEERLRKARRRRMGVALKTDTQNDQSGVFFGGVPVQRPAKKAKTEAQPPQILSSAFANHALPRVQSVTDTSTGSHASSDEESDFISNMLDMGSHHVDTDGDDYSKILDDLAGGHPSLPQRLTRKNCGPFLEELISYVEHEGLPFQHVDVWVPSYRQGAGGSQPRLFHAGSATRQDLEPATMMQLDEYGQYSTRFAFGPGCGLPGRVFAEKKPFWDTGIDEADPKVFERAGGAKVYGLKTALGIPLKTSVIGLIVVTLYSVSDIPEDQNLILKCMNDWAQFCPEPKWKLVVEMGNNGEATAEVGREHAIATHAQATSDSPEENTKFPAQITTHTSGFSAPSTEHLIAAMLGEHMPLMPISGPGEQTSSTAAPLDLLPHFMSLRLLLLRSRDRRSEVENEMIDIIKKSYDGHTRSGRRDNRDIALLLARDWQYLKGAFGESKPAAKPIEQHRSHVLGAPTVSTFSSSGAPVMMPNALPFVDPSSVSRSRSSSAVDADGNINIVENS
eukprot:CAMPEP_0172453600 /NCGR_PEP_ID=MMETSP1065-20121228/10840_1 /TAXON_ID=265537 /ORGANISM="Amphiprora paludosa, Strain CCMP125" /LENGTH=787 /DNA_ID=CAMNT_0013205785 /DNA_START=70 /DNA_END=2433 /DNA_ORIENTATION=+